MTDNSTYVPVDIDELKQLIFYAQERLAEAVHNETDPALLRRAVEAVFNRGMSLVYLLGPADDYESELNDAYRRAVEVTEGAERPDFNDEVPF